MPEYSLLQWRNIATFVKEKQLCKCFRNLNNILKQRE